ncbi:ribonuclease H [Trifolium pratense]|uniref:Ribonuclease H n=1 Tax=Trifolium pratense TaxID=57577 RepID=A0A2K3PNQ0_TRIPR|nr:ribonuclease H [Trifolium pratense]
MDIGGCGGLFRDSDGRWLKRNIQRIGACDILLAEMWGMYTRMNMAQRQSFTHLIVESDFKLMIDMVAGNYKLNINISTLIRRIRELIPTCNVKFISSTFGVKEK